MTAFREYISERLKEKNHLTNTGGKSAPPSSNSCIKKYSKEKQEAYNEIRQLEREKRKHMEQHAKSDFVLDDGVQNQILILEEELKAASRTQAKTIRDKLNSLNKDKDKLRSSIDKIEEKIHNLENKIQRLNDQIWKVSLKVSIIGHDLENEYWYFKDDLSRIYVKEIKTNTWKYYNDEESVQELEESLITKGIREKKLREGLRKLRGKLKLRKRKDGRSDEKQKSEANEADE